MSDTLVVNEIYLSLQGESTLAGLPCVFIRLTACDLRCSYCDTAYAFTEGEKRSLGDIQAEVRRLAQPFGEGRSSKSEVRSYRLPLVELTGGEPLLQKNSLPLMRALCEDGFTVLLETSGAHDIAPVDPRVRRIMDLKCPGSGEVARNRWENLTHLKSTDEIKFVIATREDYEWAKACIAQHKLEAVCPLLFPGPTRSQPSSGTSRSRRCRRARPRSHARNWRSGSSPMPCRCGFKCSCTRSSGRRKRRGRLGVYDHSRHSCSAACL